MLEVLTTTPLEEVLQMPIQIDEVAYTLIQIPQTGTTVLVLGCIQILKEDLQVFQHLQQILQLDHLQ